MPIGPQETVLVPLGSRIVCAGVVAMGLVVTAALIAWGRPEPLLRALPAIAFAMTGSIVLFWLPRVDVTPARVEIVNAFRSYRVTWPAIREVGTRWSMTLYTVSGRIEAWAAPAPGPLTGAASRASQRPGRGDRRGGQGAAAIVRAQWEAYREAGALGAVEGEGVESNWHPVRIALMLLLGAGTVLGIALP